jgi:hypothetical protein
MQAVLGRHGRSVLICLSRFCSRRSVRAKRATSQARHSPCRPAQAPHARRQRPGRADAPCARRGRRPEAAPALRREQGQDGGRDAAAHLAGGGPLLRQRVQAAGLARQAGPRVGSCAAPGGSWLQLLWLCQLQACGSCCRSPLAQIRFHVAMLVLRCKVCSILLGPVWRCKRGVPHAGGCSLRVRICLSKLYWSCATACRSFQVTVHRPGVTQACLK